MCGWRATSYLGSFYDEVFSSANEISSNTSPLVLSTSMIYLLQSISLKLGGSCSITLTELVVFLVL
jgi:hypothetical protein